MGSANDVALGSNDNPNIDISGSSGGWYSQCGFLYGTVCGIAPLDVVIPFRFSDEVKDSGLRLESAPSAPWYENACLTDALKIGALTVGVDAIGLIPEGGGAKTIARGIGHWGNYRGIVADQFGAKVIHQAGGVSNTLTLTGGLRDADWVSIGVGVAGFVPVLGQAAAGASIVWDGVKTWKSIQACR